MLVLLTGSSGTIGTNLVDQVDPEKIQFRRADLVDNRPESPHPFVPLDVTDPEACRQACAGVDAVVHLAASPVPTADFRSVVLPVNMVGTYNVVEAAVAAGVGRFVFASSAQAVEGYPLDHQVREADSPRPANDYGVGKAFGEALCAAYAGRSATSFVSLRIANYSETVPGADETLRDRAAWLSPRDALQLVTLALTAPVDGHIVANGVSDNAVKRLSLDATRRTLGYAPEDDAFG
jgi:uronate dehydrogenase